MSNVFDTFDIKKYPLQKMNINGAQIGYRKIGSGQPLLLITGYGATMDMWAPELLRDLAEKYQLILFDNRGIACSTSDETSAFSIRLFADDAAKLLDGLGIKRAHVLGWSMGTYIAQELALNYPLVVDKLILHAGGPGGEEAIPPEPAASAALADTSGTMEEREARAFASLFPADWLMQNPCVSEYFPIPEIAATPAVMEPQLRALMSWSGSYSRLNQLICEVLLISGTEDVVVPLDNSRIIAEKLTTAWYIPIAGGGHGLMYQYPRKMAATIGCFLD
ncbi:MAG: alpha/beta hydrolase [Negativicutes bacterium]|jgi:pimeloyl-ACP methyl ester carboxylesterase